jgi:hypothetical protein
VPSRHPVQLLAPAGETVPFAHSSHVLAPF